MANDPEVLIVGAGPTGLTLACELARRGIGVRIVEKSPEPQRGSRGKGLQPRTLEVFDDLGVVDRVLRQGMDYPRMRAHFGWFALPWNMMERTNATEQIPYPNPCMLGQDHTEAILRERLGELGVQVEFATSLTRLSQTDERVTATLDTGASLRVSFLVGADGGHSEVRKQLGIALSGETLAQPTAVVGDVRVRGLDRDAWHVWPRARSGAVALCPLPDGEHFQMLAQVPVSSPAPFLTIEAVRDFVAHSTGARRWQLTSASWLSLYRPQARMVDRYRAGRVFLAGDAAHVHPPTGGQGLNIGVQDAANLGWKLAAVLRGAPATLLDSYEEERKPIAEAVLGLSRALYEQGAKRQKRGAITKQLGTHYRTSSLSVEARGDAALRSLRAGDRAPDARIASHGKPQRLFDIYRGPHFTVLTFDGVSARALQSLRSADIHVVNISKGPATANTTITDPIGALVRAYGAAPSDVFVIRPDGYLGLCASTPDAVRPYLQGVAAPR